MTEELAQPVAGTSLVAYMGAKYGIEPNKFLSTLINTVFPAPKPNDPPVTNEQVAAFLIVAKEYELNPFIKEIYAFPAKGGGVVPIVSIDGWLTLINRQPQLDGIEFEDVIDDTGKITAITTIIYRKDRGHPTRITEYMSECRRDTGPWGSHPTRMLRHKSLIQCGRVAFGLAGIFDPDEGERILESGDHTALNVATAVTGQTKSERVAEKIKKPKPPESTATEVKTEPAAETKSEPIEVCGSCGATESLTEVEGVMLCPDCKPKPIATPAEPVTKGVVEGAPPWAQPKSEAKPAAEKKATKPATTKPAAMSLEDQVAEMAGTKVAKARTKPANNPIKKVALPEFVDRESEADAWTKEQYDAAIEGVKKVPGAHENADGQLRQTVLEWVGLPLDQINGNTLVVLTGIFNNFSNKVALKAWAIENEVWAGE